MTLLFDKTVFVVRCTLSLLMLLLLMLMLVVAAAITLNKFRSFYAECIAAPMSRLLLALWGIRLQVHGALQPMPGQVMSILS